MNFNRTIYIFFLFSTSALFSQEVENKYPVDSLHSNSLTINEDYLIVSSSIQLFADTVELRINKDFLYDSYRKKIRIFYNLKSISYIKLRYKRLRLFSTYQDERLPEIISMKNVKEAKNDSLRSQIVFQSKKARQSYFNQLKRNGSIYRGFKFGSSNNLNLESGMNIYLEGPISKSIQIQAALTDESIPIQPEGTTQRLSDVDKIYIKLKSPYGNATVGDFNLSKAGNNLFSYQRRLKGLDLNYQSEAIKAESVISSSRAIFHSNRFLTKEGLQGPYKLKGKDNSDDIIVIAGSERVYLNAKELKRGRRNDYIIEYSNGSIFFTAKQLIRGNQRIEVDFEYVSAQQRFGKNINLAEIEYKNASFKLKSRFVQESDDESAPLSGFESYTDDEIKLINSAGNDAQKASFSSIRKAENMDGYYKKEFSSNFQDTILVYDASKQSPYNASFTAQGSGKGSYRRISRFLNEYEYVGKNKGDYEPITRLSLPSENKIFLNQLSYHYSKNNSIGMNYALSDFDQNKLSPYDDEENIAHYFKLNHHHSEQDISIFKKISFNQGFELYEKNFQSLNKFYQADYFSKWGLSALERQDTRYHYRNDLAFSFSDRDKSKLAFNYINERHTATVVAIEFEESFKFQNNFPDFMLSLNQSNTKEETNLEFIDRTDLSGRFLKNYNSFSYQVDYQNNHYKRKNSSFEKGFLNQETKLKLNYSFEKKKQLSYSFAFLDETLFDSLKQDFRDFGRNYEHRLESHFQTKSFRNKTILSARNRNISSFFKFLSTDEKLNYIDLAFQDSSYTNQESYLLESESIYQKKAFKFRLNYQARSELSAFKDVVYRQVAQGLGQFRLDSTLKQYVRDDIRGDYLRFIIPNGRFEAISKVRSEVNLNFVPRKTNLFQWLKALEFKTRFLLADETKHENTLDVYLLQPSALFSDKSLNARLEFYQSLFIKRENATLNHMLDFQHLRQIKNDVIDEFSDLNYSQIQNTWKAKTAWKISPKFNSFSQISYKKLNKKNPQRNELNREIESIRLSEQIRFFPSSKLNSSFELSYIREQSLAASSPVRLQVVDLKFDFNYSLVKRAFITGNFISSAVRVLENKDQLYIVNELADGKKEGSNLSWALTANYKFLNNLSANLQYNGRKFVIDDDIFHLFRLEMRLNL